MAEIRHIAYSLKQRVAIKLALKRSGRVYRPFRVPEAVLKSIALITVLMALPLLTTCLIITPTQDDAAVETDTVQTVFRVQENMEPGLALYRNNASRAAVLDFYAEHVGDRAIAEAIAREAEANDIPLSLAFSLAWAESRFYPRAVNHNAASIDRGLFQLNNRSFPDLTIEEYFDPEVNSSVGLAYLRWCIDTGGNEVVALAMYNAGQGRVEGNGTPLMTLRHISDILEYRDLLDAYFAQRVQFIKVAEATDTKS